MSTETIGLVRHELSQTTPPSIARLLLSARPTRASSRRWLATCSTLHHPAIPTPTAKPWGNVPESSPRVATWTTRRRARKAAGRLSHALLNSSKAPDSPLSCGAAIFVLLGNVDEVALVEAPLSPASAGQRFGHQGWIPTARGVHEATATAYGAAVAPSGCAAGGGAALLGAIASSFQRATIAASHRTSIACSIWSTS